MDSGHRTTVNYKEEKLMKNCRQIPILLQPLSYV
jgi:hypothetical protein